MRPPALPSQVSSLHLFADMSHHFLQNVTCSMWVMSSSLTFRKLEIKVFSS